ncbi:MAG TPA: hypothetical protein VK966_08335 [Longimicrobiales bacterium]|nr:hypothetical protein [Longimicrobiales bacterium]
MSIVPDPTPMSPMSPMSPTSPMSRRAAMSATRRPSGAAALTFALLALLVGPAPTTAQDEDIPVRSGGIEVEGWVGQVDARAAEDGMTVEDTRFAAEGDGFRITTGPGTTYWNPANTATGSYTVSARFHEPAYMALNSHPHPYGIVVAGNGMGTNTQSYLYCSAYGNGTYIVRGFGPEPFQLNGPRPQQHPAVNRAQGEGSPVTQEIAVAVRDDAVECIINGEVVATFDRDQVVGEGLLSSTDGVWGLRVGHNADVIVTGLGTSQP